MPRKSQNVPPLLSLPLSSLSSQYTAILMILKIARLHKLKEGGSFPDDLYLKLVSKVGEFNKWLFLPGRAKSVKTKELMMSIEKLLLELLTPKNIPPRLYQSVESIMEKGIRSWGLDLAEYAEMGEET